MPCNFCSSKGGWKIRGNRSVEIHQRCTPWNYQFAPENRVSQKETIAFQPSIFRGRTVCFGAGSFRTQNFRGFFCCEVVGSREVSQKEKVLPNSSGFYIATCSNSSGCEEGRLLAWIRNHMKSLHVQTHLIESIAFQLRCTCLKPSTSLPSNTWWRQAQACFQISRGFNINDICSAWKLACERVDAKCKIE